MSIDLCIYGRRPEQRRGQRRVAGGAGAAEGRVLFVSCFSLLLLFAYIYIYIYNHCIYIYIEREIYIYVYTYIYRERERQREISSYYIYIYIYICYCCSLRIAYLQLFSSASALSTCSAASHAARKSTSILSVRMISYVDTVNYHVRMR